MANPIEHFEISGKNGKKLQGFYKKLFGWKMQSWGDDYAMVKAGGKKAIGGGINTGDRYVTVYVTVKNLEKSLGQAKKLGGKVVMKPTAIEGTDMVIAMFKDPAGNLIGLVK